MSAENYIANLEQPMKDICEKLQNIVTAFSPEIKEDIKWGVPTYSINGNICSIMAHKKHVNFQLFQGAHIKGVQEIEGTGKDMRHLKFTKPEEIKETVVRKCLEQAVNLDSNRT